jgi:hypothetical protein
VIAAPLEGVLETEGRLAPLTPALSSFEPARAERQAPACRSSAVRTREFRAGQGNRRPLAIPVALWLNMKSLSYLSRSRGKRARRFFADDGIAASAKAKSAETSKAYAY